MVPNWSNPPVTTAGAQERAENIRGTQPRYGGSSPAQTLVRTGGDMDGLLEKFVSGGYRGVQLTAYSWQLADSILSVSGGCISEPRGRSPALSDSKDSSTDSYPSPKARIAARVGES